MPIVESALSVLPTALSTAAVPIFTATKPELIAPPNALISLLESVLVLVAPMLIETVSLAFAPTWKFLLVNVPSRSFCPLNCVAVVILSISDFS